MDWTLVGALAELLGAVAVVLSLVYLSRQVQQNTSAVKTANAVTVQGNFQQLARMFYTDREMGDVVLRMMRDDDDMTSADRLAAYAYFFDFLKTAELAFYQYSNDDLRRFGRHRLPSTAPTSRLRASGGTGRNDAARSSRRSKWRWRVG